MYFRNVYVKRKITKEAKKFNDKNFQKVRHSDPRSMIPKDAASKNEPVIPTTKDISLL